MTGSSAALADALWLIASGEPTEAVASRLGVQPGSVARLLYRHGFVAEARPFGAIQARTDRARRRSA